MGIEYRRRWISWLGVIALWGCEAPDGDGNPAFRATGELIALSGGDGGARYACITCHGVQGEGDGQSAPRLAGLDAGYLHRQIDDYAAGRRQHGLMRAIALKLSMEDRARVSAYYAALPQPQPPTAAARDAVAAHLYAEGDAERGLAACATCHGDRGEGVGPGNPPLAAQPAAYLEAQLAAWRQGLRHSDPLDQMGEISRRLTAGESRALAAHAAALPGRHPQAVAAASPQEHRDDQ